MSGDNDGTRTAGADRGAELRREIEEVRQDLVRNIGELDRRRHALTDVKGQLRRHPGSITIVALALFGIGAGAIAWSVARRRRRNEIGARVARLREAVGRMIDKPNRVATDPGVGRKIAAAAGTAAASIFAKRLMTRLLDRGTRAEHGTAGAA